MQNKRYRDAYVSAHLFNTIASQIFSLRESEEFTQAGLAEKTDMGQSRISALEDPNNDNVEIKTLQRIASAFDVALTVRFVPFSEIVNWTDRIMKNDLAPPSFSEDQLMVSTSKTDGRPEVRRVRSPSETGSSTPPSPHRNTDVAELDLVLS